MASSEHSERYSAPIVRLDSLDQYKPSDQRTLFVVDLPDGMEFWFLQDLGRREREPLVVTFHGARDPSLIRLPYFVRATSLAARGVPHLLFSDPTMSLDEDSLRLCWYIGTENVNVDDLITEVVGKALAHLGDDRCVQFEGSSGGGTVALRIAARFQRSGVLCYSPQTDPYRYEGGTFAETALRIGSLGETPSAGLRERFSVVKTYAELGADHVPLTRYVQNTGDSSHIRHQAKPFFSALGLEIGDGQNSQQIGLISYIAEQHGDGHIAPPGVSWEKESQYLSEALHTRWRRTAAAESGEPPSRAISIEPGFSSVDSSLTSGEVRYRTVHRNPGGRYVRVFFHSPIARSTDDSDHRFRLPTRPDPDSALDVSVSDPTLAADAGLKAGWYLGSPGDSTARAIARHICSLVDDLGAEHAILIGHSTGGFAALQVGLLLPDAHVVVANPTIALDSFSVPSALHQLSQSTSLQPDADLATLYGAAATDLIAAARAQRGTIRSRVRLMHCLEDVEYAATQAPLLPALQRAWGSTLFTIDHRCAEIPRGSELEEFATAARDEVARSNAPSSVSSAGGKEPPTTDGGIGAPLHVAIFGSCVARDTYTRLSELTSTSIDCYVARQSLLSLGNVAEWATPLTAALDSAWQRRRLQSDAEGRGLDELLDAGAESDAVLLDFVDERHGVWEIDGTVVTNSHEFVTAGGPPPGARHVAFGSDEHLSRWRDGAISLAVTLREAGLFNRTAVLAMPWATRSVQGPSAGSSMGMTGAVANRLYPEYYAILDELGFTLLGTDGHAPLADAENRWGLAPYHYEEVVYTRMAMAILAFAGRALDGPTATGL